MARNANIGCIDIGSSKICTMVANVIERNIVEVLGVGVAPSLGIQKGIITDLPEARRAIQESVEKAERTGPKIERAYIGFSGKHISSLNNRVPVAITRRDHLVTQAALARGLMAVQRLTFPEDRKMFDPIPTRYFLDGTVSTRNPVGMHGYRLDIEAHIVTAGITYLQNLEVCLRAAGVAVEDFVPNPLVCGEAVLEMEDKEAGVILADIGGGTTDIAVFKEGGIWHTSVLPVGGNQLTRDLASGLDLPFSIAEELKVKYGSLLPEEGEGWTETISLERERYRLSREELCYIIRARVEELLRMIVLGLPRSEYTPTTVILTGGTAKLPGIEELGRELLGLSVRVEKPKGLPEAVEGLDDPAYAASIGLLLWGARKKEEVAAIPPGAFPSAFSVMGSALGRVPPMFISIPERVLSALGFERKRKE